MSDQQPDGEKPKSASQLRKEAAKAEKLAKFQEKQRKLEEQKAQAQAKPKEVSFFRELYCDLFELLG